MRLVILVAMSLMLGGAVVVAAAPAASACTSDPDVVCGVIWVLDCAGQQKPGTAIVKNRL